MAYLICFFVSLALLIFVVAFDKIVDINMTLLAIVITVGSGGFFAMTQATNLAEALLANKILYVIGSFGPLIVFIIICNICRIKLSRGLRTAMYVFQVIVYGSICATGYTDWFYRSVEFSVGSMGGSLEKTYGPMHAVCVATLLLYTMAGIGIALYSLNRRTIVSRFNVYVLLFMDMIVVAMYLLEHILDLEVELLPFFFTFGAVVYMILLLRIYNFSVYNNRSILADKLEEDGYIFFNKALKYMGSSDYAMSLFPELSEWELEKRIPGNGGRFNTFLRQPLMNFYKQDDQTQGMMDTYDYKGETYSYEIELLKDARKKKVGYVIQVSNITGFFDKDEE